ncbi:MAG: glycosyltransferase [Candidatus Hydrogenedentota bacterium]
MDRYTTIIIPAHNQAAYSRQCVTTVRRHTAPPYKLILVDSGSTDGVGDFFDSVSGAEVIHLAKNRGFAAAVNAALERAEGHVALVHTDTLVPSEWLDRLLAVLERFPELGLVGPRTNYAPSPQYMEGVDFRGAEKFHALAQRIAREWNGGARFVNRLGSFCLLIREETWRAVGPLDEDFSPGTFDDEDYCRRVVNANYRLAMAEDVFVFHFGCRTFLGMGITGQDWNELFETNRRRFEMKWRTQTESRPEALMKVHELTSAASAAYQRGGLIQAVHLLHAAEKLCPFHEKTFNDLGVICRELGDVVRAFHYLTRAVRLNPSYDEARDNLRQVAATAGRQQEAETIIAEVDAALEPG